MQGLMTVQVLSLWQGSQEIALLAKTTACWLALASEIRHLLAELFTGKLLEKNETDSQSHRLDSIASSRSIVIIAVLYVASQTMLHDAGLGQT